MLEVDVVIMTSGFESSSLAPSWIMAVAILAFCNQRMEMTILGVRRSGAQTAYTAVTNREP